VIAKNLTIGYFGFCKYKAKRFSDNQQIAFFCGTRFPAKNNELLRGLGQEKSSEDQIGLIFR